MAPLVADLNRLLTARGVPVVAAFAGGRITFSSPLGGGNARTLSVMTATAVSVIEDSIFGGSSGTSSVGQGGLGIPAAGQSATGTDRPFTVVEVPFAGWFPTTGGGFDDLGLVGTRSVQFTAQGEIATHEDFGNVQSVELSVDAPATALVEGTPVTLTGSAIDPATGEPLGTDFVLLWSVLDGAGGLVASG